MLKKSVDIWVELSWCLSYFMVVIMGGNNRRETYSVVLFIKWLDYWINWQLVVKAKQRGGLTIGNLIKQNNALSVKWLWTYLREHYYSLWFCISRSIYIMRLNRLDFSLSPKQQVFELEIWTDRFWVCKSVYFYRLVLQPTQWTSG